MGRGNFLLDKPDGHVWRKPPMPKIHKINREYDKGESWCGCGGVISLQFRYSLLLRRRVCQENDPPRFKQRSKYGLEHRKSRVKTVCDVTIGWDFRALVLPDPQKSNDARMSECWREPLKQPLRRPLMRRKLATFIDSLMFAIHSSRAYRVPCQYLPRCKPGCWFSIMYLILSERKIE